MPTTPHNSLPTGYRFDPRLGAVYDQPPRAADDLTAIRGIDTRAAAGLNHIGVYFLRQISQWTEAQSAAAADRLGMPASAISRQAWVAQARAIACSSMATPAPSSANGPANRTRLRASGPRTVMLLTAALLIGCAAVLWLNRDVQVPMHGVLAAEISAIKVPADSTLLATHVAPGDEVYTGEILLTLEKTEHLRQLEEQSRRVRRLALDLQNAESRADLEIKWRRDQLQRELSEVRSKVEYYRSIAVLPSRRTVEQPTDSSAVSNPFQLATRPRTLSERSPRGINSLLFINGISGASTLDMLPLVTAATPSGSAAGSLHGQRNEARNIEARLQQLEQMQAKLPIQVQMAAGLENLRMKHRDAQNKLTHMQSLSRETTVLCPGYGTIGQIRFAEGEHMPRDEVMVRILHTDRCYVVVHTPSERVGKLSPGDHVTVLFPEHDPCQGIVADLPLVDTSVTDASRVASVRVNAIGRPWPRVRVGSKVEVSVR